MAKKHARIYYSAFHQEQKDTLGLRLRPEVDVLHAYAGGLNTSLENDTELWLVSKKEATQKRYTPRRSARHILRIVTNDISAEPPITDGVLEALQQRAEIQRKNDRWTSWAIAATGIGGGLTAVLDATEVKAMVGGAIVGGIGGLRALYLHNHPLETQQMPEVPDLGAPIRVLRPSTE